MAKTQLNVRVDEGTARAARERALERGMSVNRYIEELVRRDTGEVGHTFVDAASDFMKQYESIFAEEFGTDREGSRAPGRAGNHESTREGRR
ncbi:antitoxin [Streptomyces sp. NPDC087263]|uniref:antitoxin n=1 Tax=Streptomyces sp. NPDC087263 TaxID=3365773 RepID=UPI003808CC43